MDTKILQDVMQKKLSRREFLSYIGAGILAIVGVTSFLKTLGAYKPKPSNQMGYGGGVYGGQKRLG